jgi:hypothetical protein
MFHKIDYYAFTIPIRLAYNEVTDEIQEFVRKTFTSLFNNSCSILSFESGWSIERAKGFYTHRLRHETTGVALSFGTINSHVYVELSGKACDCLENANLLSSLIEDTKEKCSRIDFAVDIITDIKPEEFSAYRNEKRWKFVSHIVSASGTTDYIGSRTGGRMARVYRYNEPHPRAHLLRIEAEYKGDAAKAIVKELDLRPLTDVCSAAHAVFGWSHEIWTSSSVEAVKIPYASYSPDNAATVRWLYGVVAASVRKAVLDGLIDWESFSKLILEGK